MLKQTYSQKQSQKILPKIILQQNLLAIPMLALDNIIKKELELNPMLEEGSEYDDDIVPSITDEAAEINEAIDAKSEKNDEGESASEADNESFENKMKEEYDWDEYFETESEEYKSYDSQQTPAFDNTNIKDEYDNAVDNLLLQLHLSDLNEKLIFTAEEIIGSLDENGYFTENPEEIIKDLNFKKLNTKFESEMFTEDDFNGALSFIQKNLDPPGIGARNLKECLLIQIVRSVKDKKFKELASHIVKNNTEDLRLKRYEKICSELGIDIQTVKEVIDFLHKLNPGPGLSDANISGDYIVPDVIVKKIEGNFEIFFNERFTPSIRINRDYKQLYANDKNKLNKDTKDYLVNNFNRAKWFIDAINSRRETIMKVTRAIIEKQKPFFENNGEGLLPLAENEIANEIKMDNSTISRTVRGKYMQTDFGIYELRSFFTTSIGTNDGEELSNTEAKLKLKELIDKENKNSPMSDELLTSEMNKIGIKIARRTVAKYREAMNIPAAKLRREI